MPTPLARLLASALLAGGLAGIAAVRMAAAEEVQSASKYGDMSTDTQDMLSRAGSDGASFLHTNGDYSQRRYYPNKQINPGKA